MRACTDAHVHVCARVYRQAHPHAHIHAHVYTHVCMHYAHGRAGLAGQLHFRCQWPTHNAVVLQTLYELFQGPLALLGNAAFSKYRVRTFPFQPQEICMI